MEDRIFRPDGLPPTNGYSHVRIATGATAYISGQVPLRSDGSLVEGGAAAQAEQVFQNLQLALDSVGSTFSDVVRLNYYLCDLEDLAALRTVRDRHLVSDSLPASTLLRVSGLVDPRFRVEIDAVAIVHQRGT